MKKLNPGKIGLIIKNNYIINRSIPLILFIVTLILGCIIGAMPVSDIETRYTHMFGMALNSEQYEFYKSSMESIYEDLLGFDGVFSLVFFVGAFILAFLTVLSLNGYMRDRSGNDFYHSLSVTRGEMFLANYITALINSAVTIVVSQLGGILLMDMLAGYKPMTLGEMLLEQLPVVATILLYLALFIAIAAIATVGAGSVFASIINYICINFYIPATILAVAVSGMSMFGSNLMDYLDHYPHAYAYTSPFIRYIFHCSDQMELSVLSYILLPLAILGAIALGIWLYSVKKNENSPKPLPFTRMIRPLQYLLIFDAILLGATFFEAITNSVVWCIIGGLLALFFGFIIYNAFVNKSFNGVFKNSRHMAFILIVTLVLGTVFVADILHIYKEPVPDTDNIVSSYIHITRSYEDREEYYSVDFTDDEPSYDGQYTIDDNSRELIAKLWELSKSNDYNRYYGEGREYMSVSLNIRCDNDFSSYHSYVYLEKDSQYWDELIELVNALHQSYPTESNTYYYEKTIEY